MMPDGVTGNTPDSGSGELRFDSLSGSFRGHRTVVSSEGSHPSDRGSIPLGPTMLFTLPLLLFVLTNLFSVTIP